jgi:hypothetical protein
MSEFQPVDLSEQPDFLPAVLADKSFVVLPSQGEHDTHIIVGDEGEMQYEQRQESSGVVAAEDSIFVSRAPLPQSEEAYRQQLFGQRRPKWHVPTHSQAGVPLDRIALADDSFLDRLRDGMSPSHTLYGFHQTAETATVAEALGVRYYGNPEFAAWAGSKIGLGEFGSKIDIQTPHTYALSPEQTLIKSALELRERGYAELVVKSNHSTGGMGHRVSSIDDVLKAGDIANFVPPEFYLEGGVAQGWIPEAATMMSVSTFVDFDGTYVFTNAQALKVGGNHNTAFTGMSPIDSKYLPALTATGHQLAKGYVRHSAYGPHTMDMIVPTDEWAHKLGFKVGEPVCHDENARPGASTIATEWILALREGFYGVGWELSKVDVPKGTKMADVIGYLDSQNLLIKKTGSGAHGVFVFNGGVLDYGNESAFYAIAISGNDDPEEAADIMHRTRRLFRG